MVALQIWSLKEQLKERARSRLKYIYPGQIMKDVGMKHYRKVKDVAINQEVCQTIPTTAITTTRK